MEPKQVKLQRFSNHIQQVARKGAEEVLRVLQGSVTLAQAHIHSITNSQLQHCAVTRRVGVERVYCHSARHYLQYSTHKHTNKPVFTDFCVY